MSDNELTYVAPALTELGAISALTLGSTGKNKDGGSKNPKK